MVGPCVLHCQVIYFLTDLPAIIVADVPCLHMAELAIAFCEGE